MLSISQPLKGAAGGDYYQEHATEQYYANDLARPGEWHGGGAASLRLKGKVRGEVFDRLLQGFARDGCTPLVQNAGHPTRVLGWDLTFSAPKSVSVVWALAPEDVRRQIEAAHRAAVLSALDQLERQAGVTRRGKGGRVRERAGLVFALFQDGVSRANDPQLHTHCVVLNLAVRTDGTVGALHSRPVFEAKMELGACYQTGFAALLQQRLGFHLRQDRWSFHVVGVPEALCDHFSKRRHDILQHMREHGTSGAIAAKVATLATRPRKQHLPPELIRAAWREVGQALGWSDLRVRELLAHAQSSSQAGGRSVRQAAAEPAQEPEHAASIAPTSRSEPQSEAQHTASAAMGNGPDGARENHRATAASAQPIPGGTEAGGAAANRDRTASPPPGNGFDPRGRASERSNSREQDQSRQSRPSGEQTHGAGGEEARQERRRRFRDESGQHRQAGSGWSGAEEESNRHARTSDSGASAKPNHNQPRAAHSGLANWERRRQAADPYPDSWIRLEDKPMFSKAPSWSPFAGLQAPRIILGRPHLRPWGKSRQLLDGWFMELRLQERNLFRKAPHWSPLRWIGLPALRLALKSPAKLGDRWGEVRWHARLGFIEVRVQSRRLFVNSPRPGKSRFTELPALRVLRAPPQRPQPAEQPSPGDQDKHQHQSHGR